MTQRDNTKARPGRSAGPAQAARPKVSAAQKRAARPVADIRPIVPPVEAAPFWKRKTLEQMTRTEWESLCDGCGRCCLNKLEEEDTKEIFFTDVVCKLFDAGTCRCTDYKNRQKIVPDCVKLTPEEVRDFTWLPPTCAYRLRAEGKDLMWWHHLVSGDPELVHTTGVSLKGRKIRSEVGIPDEALEQFIVKWPGKVPKAAR